MNQAITQIKFGMNEVVTQNAQTRRTLFFATISEKWVSSLLSLMETCHQIDPTESNVWNLKEDSVPAIKAILAGIMDSPKTITPLMVDYIESHLSKDQQSVELQKAISFVSEELPSYDDRTVGNMEATVRAYFL
ncbi:MAG: hypothetical protein D4R40_00605 [Nitrosomonadaceae bacterium]|nr:MAG: hypothetical protein D4R40_00605 [Nitrosomonadaceae bacterium]